METARCTSCFYCKVVFNQNKDTLTFPICNYLRKPNFPTEEHHVKLKRKTSPNVHSLQLYKEGVKSPELAEKLWKAIAEFKNHPMT